MRRRRVEPRDIEPSVSIVVAAHNEHDVIERRVRNLLELDYPPEPDRGGRRLGRVDRRDGRGRRAACRRGLAHQARPLRARRQGRRAEPRRRGVERGDRRLLRRECALAARRPAEARPQLRRSGGRLRDGASVVRGRRRDEPRGRLLAVRAVAPRAGVSARVGHGRQRADLRRAALGVDRRPAVVRARPGAAVPDGAARPARGLRPGGGLDEKPSRDIEDEYRRKVRMLRGAWVHVFAGCCGAWGRSTSSRWSHTACCGTRADPAPVLLGSSVVLVGEGWIYRVALAAQLTLAAAGRRGKLRLPIPGAGLAYYYLVVTWATLPGSSATCASGRRCCGGGSRGRGEPGARRRRRVARACAGEPVPGRGALAIKLADGGPVLYRQPASGTTPRSSSCSSCGRWSWAPSSRGRGGRSTGATRGSRAWAACCADSPWTNGGAPGTSRT